MIVAVPDEMPDTRPVPEPTEAMPEEPELHKPERVESLNVAVDPAHTATAPVMTDGKGLTVTTVVTLQPVLRL